MFCIYAPYVSKHKSNCEKQFILLMILNGKEWHYVAVKEVSALLAGIMLRWFLFVWIAFALSQLKKNSSHIKDYVAMKNFVI